MSLLRTTDLDVTEVCLAVGFTSLGTFSALFSALVGQSPSSYAADRGPMPPVPGHFLQAWTRPSTFTHAPDASGPSGTPGRPERGDSSISEKPEDRSSG